MAAADEEEYNEGEVLTGAELYLYLLRQNEEQLEKAEAKLREYGALKDTLQVLTERSRRRVLAPVAGGLAYFPAELNATNTILVLLGDSWFAERSAVQAGEIAGRRLDFLRREAEVLRQEQSSLRSKQELFLSEMPEAQDAVAQLLAETEAHRAGLGSSAAPEAQASSEPQMSATETTAATAPHHGRVSASPLASAVETPAMAMAEKMAWQAGSAPIPTPSTATAVDSDAPLDYAAVDDALATFDEEDDLTEDELIALEKELGDRLDDDAYVEQVLTERMIAKKERRIRAELQRREAAALAASPGAAEKAAPVGSVVAPTAVPLSHEELSVEAERVVSAPAATSTTFRTPADIGGDCLHIDASPAQASAAAEHVDPVGPPLSPSAGSPVASPPASMGSSSGRKAKHVHFHEDVAKETSASSGLPPSDSRPGEPPLTDALEAGGGGAWAAGQSPPSLLRSTYRIGDIVEHSLGQSAVAPLPPMPTQQAQKAKRKSLFMRDLEGDG